MERFFTVDGAVLSINHDCSVTEFASLADAFATSPLCVLRGQSTFENMLVRGRNEHWYQNNRFILYSDKYTKMQSAKIGNWFITNLYQPRSADALHCEFVDPFGKISNQIIKGNQGYASLTKAFMRIREMNNYESILNYNLLEENLKLKEEIARLKDVLEKQNSL